MNHSGAIVQAPTNSQAALAAGATSMAINLAEPRSQLIRDPGPEISNLAAVPDAMWTCYRAVRETTEALCAPLQVEDYVIQSMPDASPTKWHLAHTSWFFETFVLAEGQPDASPVDASYSYLFNSYYNAVGERIGRDRRGLLSRPTVAEVFRYRAEVDERVKKLLDKANLAALDQVRATLILGLHHEQQHQELILTDLKHALGGNPLRPLYREVEAPSGMLAGTRSPDWVEYPGGLRSVGHAGVSFAFDNETPRHQEYVAPFAVADRLVTNRDYLAFIEDGGYERPEHWLSDGWFARNRGGWTCPLYWEADQDRWRVFTLSGMRELELDEPVCHVSFYEADAFARWSGARLPTEAEWEIAATTSGSMNAGNFLEKKRFHPAPLSDRPEDVPNPVPLQLFGDVWEWTQSPYTPYRGFRPVSGALGEYNGKFMCNQMVLRGGSCGTPRSHIRATYRNFFSPEARWQFSGIRLARDV
jgi:ergothioneine biosynthesis protein EgtB